MLLDAGTVMSVPSVNAWLRLEQRPVRGTQNWVSAPTESRPWGHPSVILDPAPLGVWRSGSEIPSYGTIYEERHLYAVRLERRFSVSRIAAPGKLPRLGPPTLLLCRLRAVRRAVHAARRLVGVLT